MHMRNLTLKQLRYVEAADRFGSITNAAEEMNISQSSITAAINMLEDTLGHDVFIRTPAKGIHSTATGREALALIRRFIYQSQQFQDELNSLGGEAMGRFASGVTPRRRRHSCLLCCKQSPHSFRILLFSCWRETWPA
jgi:DNA-binding transcriptional LysR family regulator